MSQQLVLKLQRADQKRIRSKKSKEKLSFVQEHKKAFETVLSRLKTLEN